MLCNWPFFRFVVLYLWSKWKLFVLKVIPSFFSPHVFFCLFFLSTVIRMLDVTLFLLYLCCVSSFRLYMNWQINKACMQWRKNRYNQFVSLRCVLIHSDNSCPLLRTSIAILRERKEKPKDEPATPCVSVNVKMERWSILTLTMVRTAEPKSFSSSPLVLLILPVSSSSKRLQHIIWPRTSASYYSNS